MLLADSTKLVSQKSADCKLYIAGYPLNRLKALFDGCVKIEGCDVQMEAAKIGDMNTDVFSCAQTRMGDNFFSYGITSNIKSLETLFRYSYEQGFSKHQLTIEVLFAKNSLQLEE